MKQRSASVTMIVLTVLWMWSFAFAADSLERRLLDVGKGAMDCGRTHQGEKDHRAVVQCVEKQFRDGQPFRVRFDDACIDTICSWGIIRGEAGGAIEMIGFDPKACDPANDTDVWCGTKSVPCEQPKLIVKGDKLKLSCGQDYIF